jgi:hypothetical protein
LKLEQNRNRYVSKRRASQNYFEFFSYSHNIENWTTSRKLDNFELNMKAVSFQQADGSLTNGRQLMEMEQETSKEVPTEDFVSNDDDESSSELKNVEPDDSGRKCPCILVAIISLLVIAIITACLFAFNVISNDDLEGVPLLGNIDFEGFFDSDPYGGAVSPETPEDAYRWWGPGTGLELYVLNALDDNWQSEFQTSLQEWEIGAPDALTLTTRRIDYDFECEPLNGILKVCNGDYGETEWKGLNTVLLDYERNWIYSSTAMMNEFYLSGASSAQRAYTMCHELGHGFGLPHWDEDFFNRNMGNCMDYTSRPRTNAQPDRSNFEFLTALYGEVGTTLPPSESPNSNGGRAPSVGWGRRLRRHLEGKDEAPVEDVPAETMLAYQDALKLLLNVPGQSKWTLLHSEEHGEAHEVELGAFKARVYLLRA